MAEAVTGEGGIDQGKPSGVVEWVAEVGGLLAGESGADYANE